MPVINSTTDIETTDGPMAIATSWPEAGSSGPAVIVVMEAFGLNPNIAGIATRFAQEGYLAVAPDLFHRSGRMNYAPYDKLMEYREELRKGFSDSTIISDIRDTVSYLESQPGFSGPIGIVGFCLGGRVSYMAAAAVPGISAAVMFYPGNLFPDDESYSAIDDAALISIPLMGCFGADDRNPSPDIVSRIQSALTEHGVDYRFHSYAEAGHGFFCDERSSYRESAASDAWDKTLAFFKETLAS